MADLELDLAIRVAMVAIVLACLLGLALLGNPEPALPRCPTAPAAAVTFRCAP